MFSCIANSNYRDAYSPDPKNDYVFMSQKSVEVDSLSESDSELIHVKFTAPPKLPVYASPSILNENNFSQTLNGVPEVR
jgi:hypothetical protein